MTTATMLWTFYSPTRSALLQGAVLEDAKENGFVDVNEERRSIKGELNQWTVNLTTRNLGPNQLHTISHHVACEISNLIHESTTQWVISARLC